MGAVVRTKSFKSGNSIAVRLPKALGIGPGESLEIERRGAELTLRTVIDLDYERAQLDALIRELEAIGPIGGDPDDGRIEFPDRPGLY